MPKIFFPSSDPVFLNESEIVASLKDLAERLAKENSRIQKIYLFGSLAWGNAGLHSDADILIVLSHDSRPIKDRLDEFILSWLPAPVPVDVLAYTQEELQRALAEENRFFQRIVTEGKILFSV